MDCDFNVMYFVVVASAVALVAFLLFSFLGILCPDLFVLMVDIRGVICVLPPPP